MMMRSCSENWSEESDDHHDEEEVEDELSSGRKVRSYECTYCKRGFTNAQALGGHMNIHRKDRAKAKQVIAVPKPTSSSNNNSLLASPFVSAQYQYYSILDSHTNYNMYFHPSTAPNPRNPPPLLPHHQEFLGPNLSLQIGPTSHVHTNELLRRPPIHKDGELDLELRLGHHPPY